MSGEVYLNKFDRKLIKYLTDEIYKDYSGLECNLSHFFDSEESIYLTDGKVITGEVKQKYSIDDIFTLNEDKFEDLLFDSFIKRIVKKTLKFILKYDNYNKLLYFIRSVSIDKFVKLGYMKIEYNVYKDKNKKSRLKYDGDFKHNRITVPTNIIKSRLDIYGGIFCLNNRVWFSKIKWNIIATVISIVSIFISIFK